MPDTSTVDLIVTTRDKWTISLDAEVSSNGNSFVKLYDDNILGWGHMFAISTYINYKNGHYGGNVFEYENPNIMGTFFSGRLIAGHGFDHTDYGAEIKKEFIRPTDYGAGASFYYQKEPIGIYPLDSTVQSRDREWNLWFGKSRYIRGLNSSFFFTGRYNDLRFTQRPDVADTLNPYFHNKRSVLLSVGLYRERFRTSNLIYGYGVNEDIAYGFRFTLTGGHTWGEFGNRWYVGGDFSAGYFTSFGYMRWSIELGSYINTRDGKFYRTALVSNINYFSNLLGTGRYKVRQFLNFNYTRGWNRLDGFRESIGFVDEARLRGLREDVYGCHRLVGTSGNRRFHTVENSRISLRHVRIRRFGPDRQRHESVRQPFFLDNRGRRADQERKSRIRHDQYPVGHSPQRRRVQEGRLFPYQQRAA